MDGTRQAAYVGGSDGVDRDAAAARSLIFRPAKCRTSGCADPRASARPGSSWQARGRGRGEEHADAQSIQSLIGLNISV